MYALFGDLTISSLKNQLCFSMVIRTRQQLRALKTDTLQQIKCVVFIKAMLEL